MKRSVCDQPSALSGKCKGCKYFNQEHKVKYWAKSNKQRTLNKEKKVTSKGKKVASNESEVTSIVPKVKS